MLSKPAPTIPPRERIINYTYDDKIFGNLNDEWSYDNINDVIKIIRNQRIRHHYLLQYIERQKNNPKLKSFLQKNSYRSIFHKRLEDYLNDVLCRPSVFILPKEEKRCVDYFNSIRKVNVREKMWKFVHSVIVSREQRTFKEQFMSMISKLTLTLGCSSIKEDIESPEEIILRKKLELLDEDFRHNDRFDQFEIFFLAWRPITVVSTQSNLKYMKLGQHNIERLIEEFRNDDIIAKLSLANARVKYLSSGMCQCISSMKNLKYLDLSQNCIDDESVKYLVEMFQTSASNSSLEKLVLAGNRITGVGARTLVESFLTSKSSIIYVK